MKFSNRKTILESSDLLENPFTVVFLYDNLVHQNIYTSISYYFHFSEILKCPFLYIILLIRKLYYI